MPKLCQCGSTFHRDGVCMACNEDAVADRLFDHALVVKALSKRIAKNADLKDAVPALHAAHLALRDSARNTRHVASALRPTPRAL